MFAEELLYGLVHFAFFYGLFALISIPLFNVEDSVFWVLLAAIPFFWNLISRFFIPITVFMLTTHLLMPVLAFMLFDDIFQRFFAVSITVIFIIYSFIIRIKGRGTLEPTGSLIMSAALVAAAFVGTHFNNSHAPAIYTALIVIIIITSEIYSRMTKIDMSLEVITRTSDQPVRQILKFDNKVMPVLIIIIILSALVFRFVLVDPILTQISELSLPTFEIETEPPEPGFVPQGGAGMGAMMMPGMEEEAQTHVIWEILEAIVLFIIQIVFVVGPIAALIYGAITLYKSLAHKRQNLPYEEGADEKEFIAPEIVKKSRKSILSYFNFNEDKTRRAFRKKILKYRKQGVNIIISDTPNQMAERIDKEDISSLVKDYLQVRYGK